jgi:hypothetical protein
MAEERSSILDPLERSSEIIFGLIMAVTFTSTMRRGESSCPGSIEYEWHLRAGVRERLWWVGRQRELNAEVSVRVAARVLLIISPRPSAAAQALEGA